MDPYHLKRPPGMGEMKRLAEAQALTLRAELKAAMRLDGLALDEVAGAARLNPAALQAFFDGAPINPRWQAKLAAWLDHHAGSAG